MLLQGEKQALNALDVQIIAVPEKMTIRVAVPTEFITTEQTSVCLFIHNKKRRSKVTACLPDTNKRFL